MQLAVRDCDCDCGCSHGSDQLPICFLCVGLKNAPKVVALISLVSDHLLDLLQLTRRLRYHLHFR